MTFCERMRERAAPIWEAEWEHPFVRGIGDGTLDPEKFKVWVRQDYLYLVEYSRVFALAAARAGDLETMSRFATLLDVTLNTEMELHRAYAREFAITPEELEREEMLPTTRAYTDHLVRAAWEGSLAEIVAALLPCAWGYCEIGTRLAEAGLPEELRFARWIEMYSSKEFLGYTQWLKGLIDRLAAGRSEAELARLERLFLTSSRYEHRFWEMCWSGEAWGA